MPTESYAAKIEVFGLGTPGTRLFYEKVREKDKSTWKAQIIAA